MAKLDFYSPEPLETSAFSAIYVPFCKDIVVAGSVPAQAGRAVAKRTETQVRAELLIIAIEYWYIRL